MKFILICAKGRSGSTTLQRIINTIEESNINGENWGAINKLIKFKYIRHGIIIKNLLIILKFI